MTNDIGLELSGKNRIDNAITVGRVGICLMNEMPVKQIERGNEVLVRVLLFVSGQVVSMGPGHVEQHMRYQRGASAGVKLLEQPRNLANYTLVLGFRVRRKFADMSIGQKVIPELRRVDQTLENAAHEAGVAEVDKAAETNRGCRREAFALRMLLQEVHFLLRRTPRTKALAQTETLAGLGLIVLRDSFKVRVIDVVAALVAI